MGTSEETLGFIGTGTITAAIVEGLHLAGKVPRELLVSRRGESVSRRLQGQFPALAIEDSNEAIVARSDLLFLAVRPEIAREVLAPLRLRPGQKVISLIAGLPEDEIHAYCGPEGKIIRAVPLPAVSKLAGITVLSRPLEAAEALFETLGGVIIARSDNEFDALTMPSTLMGLYFGLQDIMTREISRAGCDPDEVRRLLASVFLGLSETTAASASGFEALRKAHSTPSGLNEGLYRMFLENGGQEALEAAMRGTLRRIVARRS